MAFGWRWVPAFFVVSSVLSVANAFETGKAFMLVIMSVIDNETASTGSSERDRRAPGTAAAEEE